MLAIDSLNKLLREQTLRISYIVTDESSGPAVANEELWVDPDNQDAPATKMFRGHFFGDRIHVTLGLFAYTHDKRYARARKTLPDRAHVIDLRANENKLTIYPHETVIVQSNERFVLSGSIAAYILPRLRNADTGLLYVPSYIDPYWDGILQAVIINTTANEHELQLGEGIAICRFYRVDGSVPTSDRDRFASKSHHYGLAWPKLINESVDPFPMRKRPKAAGLVTRFRVKARQYKVAQRALGGISAIAVIVFLFKTGAIYQRIEEKIGLIDQVRSDLTALTTSTGEIRNKFEEIEENLMRQQARVPRYGDTKITFARGTTKSRRRVDLPIDFSTVATIFVFPSHYTGYLDLSATAEQARDGTTIILDGRLDRKATVERDIDVHWLLLLR